jgi:hypothetical protein
LAGLGVAGWSAFRGWENMARVYIEWYAGVFVLYYTMLRVISRRFMKTAQTVLPSTGAMVQTMIIKRKEWTNELILSICLDVQFTYGM